VCIDRPNSEDGVSMNLTHFEIIEAPPTNPTCYDLCVTAVVCWESESYTSLIETTVPSDITKEWQKLKGKKKTLLYHSYKILEREYVHLSIIITLFIMGR
jgi:hypothetical protein